MVVTFATGLIPTVTRSATSSKSISSIFVNLFKNKGVQAGTGLAAAGGGLFVLGGSAKSVASDFGIPPIIIGIVVIVMIFLLIGRKR